jgi:DNA-binding transcriptional regulator YhcF (GntR family)
MTTSKVARKVRKLRKAQAVERHVRLYRWLLESPAYRSLSVYARCLLIELKALYNGSNNGEFFLSVRRAAERLNTGTNQAMAAFRELEDRGFIKPRQRGSFQWKQRHATSWLLTEYDDDMTGHKATNDFMKWQPNGASKNKKRLPERQQSVAGAATDDGENARPVAGAATDSPVSNHSSVAGVATQICYQGGHLEKNSCEPRAATSAPRRHVPRPIWSTHQEGPARRALVPGSGPNG